MSPVGEDDDAEFRRIAELTTTGDLDAARTALRHLGDRAEAAGRTATAARALRLSATLDRVLGDLNGAVATARRAVKLAEYPAETAVNAGGEAVAAFAELGESLVALGLPADAAAAYKDAADRAGAEDRVALERMRAFALSAAGQGAEAAAVLRDLATDTVDPTARASLFLQAASSTNTDVGLWRDAHDAVEAAAGEAKHTMRADLDFLDASRALQNGDLANALSAIRSARQHALDGVAVLQYIAAAVAESAVAELAGDDTAAYGSLATGYATLGDLVGKQLSGSTFQGPLMSLRDRWGPSRFAAAKREYEAARRSGHGKNNDAPVN